MEYKVNEIVSFDKYMWRVLEVQDDKVLLLTEEIITKMPYHYTYTETTWENSDIRKYLNTDFYNSFDQKSKELILLNKIINIPNQWYKTDAGADTFDYVFLLDVYDVVAKYFGDSSDRLIRKSEKQRYWFNFRDSNNIKRLAKYKGQNFWWWLRSPGRNNKTAVYIHGNPIGCVGINGNSVFFSSYPPERNGGVRPAIWIKIK
ncbi:DUF6273 domain-containing protein [Haploplasma axanthum]|uniref:DUF6273 domain-containing protein n=1 Tax=Haploplasma axanthum TaxID=29552 RepID=A0A449BDT2_HAPAX|nr:DUF6273 domain-containing protein [Haploplasma axanthum]VEU80588.1 Uncharacterised protein [Haploplasma axanthum]